MAIFETLPRELRSEIYAQTPTVPSTIIFPLHGATFTTSHTTLQIHPICHLNPIYLSLNKTLSAEYHSYLRTAFKTLCIGLSFHGSTDTFDLREWEEETKEKMDELVRENEWIKGFRYWEVKVLWQGVSFDKLHVSEYHESPLVKKGVTVWVGDMLRLILSYRDAIPPSGNISKGELDFVDLQLCISRKSLARTPRLRTGVQDFLNLKFENLKSGTLEKSVHMWEGYMQDQLCSPNPRWLFREKGRSVEWKDDGGIWLASFTEDVGKGTVRKTCLKAEALGPGDPAVERVKRNFLLIPMFAELGIRWFEP